MSDVHTYLDSGANASVAISGQFGCENFRRHNDNQPALLIPTGSVLPVPTYTDGEIIYIPVSGVFAITSASDWKIISSNASLAGL